MNKLEQLKKVSKVVADSDDIDEIKKFQLTDATTNPTLLFKAAQLPHYRSLIESAKLTSINQGGSNDDQITNYVDILSVKIGGEILAIVSGRVSTEISAKLSFDTSATIEKAKKLIGLYHKLGISSDRVLIKIAATWEGIKAAEQLEKENIQCNLTLLFGFHQAGVFLISPFVGRISDWHKKIRRVNNSKSAIDSGILSVCNIFNYYKQHHYSTVVMLLVLEVFSKSSN